MTKLTIEIVAINDRSAFRHLSQIRTLITESALQNHGNVLLARGEHAYSTSDVTGSSSCHVQTIPDPEPDEPETT